MAKDFTHLHVHTEYSVLDGINKIKKLAKYVKNQGMSACAITDHGVLHGILEWYKAGKEAGINPILGVEAYLTYDEDGIEDNKDKTRDNHHCVLLAQNEEGLRNLIWLTNQANLHNFYYKPRISVHNFQLRSNGNRLRSNGIIATSSCLGGIGSKQGEYVQSSTSESKPDGTFRDAENRVTKTFELFAGTFGDRFYAEIQDNAHLWQQNAYNCWLVPRAREMGIPLIITSDAHFLDKPDKETHNLIMAQQMKCTLEEYTEDEDGLVYGDGHYIRTPLEMYQAACKYNAEEAFWNTNKIAQECSVDITLGEYKNPHFDITQENDFEDFKRWQSKGESCGV